MENNTQVIKLEVQEETVMISFENKAEEMKEKEAALLFERFYIRYGLNT